MSALARNASKPDRPLPTHPRREPLGPACLLRRRGAARLSDYSGRDHTEAQPVHPNWSTARTPGPGLSNTPEGSLSRVIPRAFGDHIRQIRRYSAWGPGVRLLQATLLVFLAASARAGLVTADFFASRRHMKVVLGTIRAGLWRPARGQKRTARCGRGAAVSQPQLDFHVLYVAGDRELDRVSPKCVTYSIDRLDCAQIDQRRHGEAVDGLVRVSLRIQRPHQDANAFPAAIGIPCDDFAEPRYCRGNWRCRGCSIRQESGDMRDGSRSNHAKHDRNFQIGRLVVLQRLQKREQWFNRRLGPQLPQSTPGMHGGPYRAGVRVAVVQR